MVCFSICLGQALLRFIFVLIVDVFILFCFVLLYTTDEQHWTGATNRWPGRCPVVVPGRIWMIPALHQLIGHARSVQTALFVPGCLGLVSKLCLAIIVCLRTRFQINLYLVCTLVLVSAPPTLCFGTAIKMKTWHLITQQLILKKVATMKWDFN